MLLILIVLLTGAAAVAEERERATEPPGGMPPADRLESVLEAWLEEGDDLHAAWAGWIVAERGLARLTEAVVERLVRSGSGQGPRHPDYYRDAALLDAVVRVGGTLPARTVTRLAATHTEAVTVLLCRREAFEPIHLEVFTRVGRGTDLEAYVAIGNRLAEWRVPAFTARILANLELRRWVRIWDRDPPYPVVLPPTAHVPGDGIFRVPDRYPPVAGYALSFTASGRNASQCISQGRRSVYARRTVTHGDEIGLCATGRSPDPRHEVRHAWLRSFLGKAKVPALPFFATIDVRWTGGRQPWTRQTTRAVEALHGAFRTWRDVLHARGLITDEDRRTLDPTIRWEILDRRMDRRRPLPPFPDVPFDSRVPEKRPAAPSDAI